jgi:hypothetical protein
MTKNRARLMAKRPAAPKATVAAEEFLEGVCATGRSFPRHSVPIVPLFEDGDNFREKMQRSITIIAHLKQRARKCKAETYALSFAHEKKPGG